MQQGVVHEVCDMTIKTGSGVTGSCLLLSLDCGDAENRTSYLSSHVVIRVSRQTLYTTLMTTQIVFLRVLLDQLPELLTLTPQCRSKMLINAFKHILERRLLDFFRGAEFLQHQFPNPSTGLFFFLFAPPVLVLHVLA